MKDINEICIEIELPLQIKGEKTENNEHICSTCIEEIKYESDKEMMECCKNI